MPASIVPASKASEEGLGAARGILGRCLADLAPRDLTAERTYAALAEDGGLVVGAVVLSWTDETLEAFRTEAERAGYPLREPACVLESLAVRESHRGRGIGAALVEHSIGIAASGGFRAVYAATLLRERHGSQGVLVRCGFRVLSGAFPLREPGSGRCGLCLEEPCGCEVVLLVAYPG